MWSNSDSFNSSFQNEDNTESLLSPFSVKTITVPEGNLVPGLLPLCVSSSTCIVFSTGRDVLIFKEESSELACKLETDSTIKSIALSEDSCLLLMVTLREVRLYHIPSERWLWTQSLESSNLDEFDACFFNSNAAVTGVLKIYLSTKGCDIYTLPSIVLCDLYEGVENGRHDEMLEGFSLNKLDLHEKCPNINVCSIIQLHNSVPSIGVIVQFKDDGNDEDFFSIEEIIQSQFHSDWQSTPDDSSDFKLYDLTGFGNIKKAANTRDGKYIIILNEEVISILCAFTNTILKQHSQKDTSQLIHDFIIYETADSNNSLISERMIGALQANFKSPIECHVTIRKFFTFDVVYTLPCMSYAQFVENKPNQDFWCIVTGDKSNDLEDTFKNLEIKVLSVCQPEARVQRLVHRKKFQQAEVLAKASNLDLEIILKSKIACILNELSSCDYNKTTNLFSDLENSLKSIKDANFIQSCMSFSSADVKVHKQFLLCIQAWAISNSKLEESTNGILLQINSTLNKITTFEICASYNSSFSLKDFLSKNLLEYLLSELKANSMRRALLIWHRHKDEFLVSINNEVLQEIINALPDYIESETLVPFLSKDFLPSILITLPDSVESLANWLIYKVQLAEFYEKDLWPENGLQLITVFQDAIQDLLGKEKQSLIKLSDSVSCTSIYKKSSDPSYQVGRLNKLLRHLHWINILKTQLNCKMPLSEFQKFEKEVIFTVLDRIDSSQVSECFKLFIQPYVVENEIELDYSLEQYIKSYLQSPCNLWDEGAWEERFLNIVDCIYSIDRWINSALLIVSRSTVPWCPQVEKLVDKVLSSDHARKQEFEIQRRLVGLKEILMKYDIKNFPLNNKNMIEVLVSYILKQNKPSALDDAKKILSSDLTYTADTDVHCKYLHFALTQNRLSEFYELFSTLPPDISASCCPRLLKLISAFLDDEIMLQIKRDLVESFLHAGIYLIQFNKIKNSTDEKLLMSFRCLLKLQDEYGISMTVSQVNCKEDRKSLLDSAIQNFMDEKPLTKKKEPFSEKKTSDGFSPRLQLNRLGDILMFGREEILGFMITKCLEYDSIDKVLDLCKELTTSHQSFETSQILLQVIYHFYQNFHHIKSMNFSVIIETIGYLVSQAITYCKEGSFEECLKATQLSTYLFSLKEITGQQNFMLSTNSFEKKYNTWNYYTLYQDKGFQIDCDPILEFVSLLVACFQKSDTCEMAVIMQALQVIIHMKDRGQKMAALRTLFLCCSTLPKLTNNLEISQAIASEILLIASSVIQEALTSRKADLYFTFHVFSLLSEDNRKTSLESLLKSSSRNLNQLISVGEIGMKFDQIMSSGFFRKYENIYKRAYLLQKYNVKSVPSEGILSSNPESNWAVVKDLVLSQDVELPMIVEFCKAFHLNGDDFLTAYLKLILSKSEKICSNIDFDEKEMMLALKKAENVNEYIENQELAYETFLDLLNKISPYCYEILFFIEEHLLALSADIQTLTPSSFSTGIELLRFLSVYKRVSKPNELEKSLWRAAHPHGPNLPAISEVHLPFNYILESSNQEIINSELTSNTIDVWLKMAKLLKIPGDHLTIVAIKNTVNNYLSLRRSEDVMLNRDAQLLHTIEEMLKKINDYEKSVACASWIFKRMPPGGNKVSTAWLAVKFSEQWLKKCAATENVNEICTNVVSLYQKSTIEATLHKRNLSKPEFLSKIHSPYQLIEYLIQSVTFARYQNTKVIKAALGIADFVKIDLTDILMKFIFKCLNVGNITSNLDETFCDSPTVVNEDDSDENMFKIINLLLNLPDSVLFHLCEGLKKSLYSILSIQRSKLIFCMISVFGTETVSTALDLHPQVFSYLVPSLYCGELESFGLPYSVQILSNCSKVELVQRILTTNTGARKSVTLCVKLCLEYDIWDICIWEVIFKHLTTKNMEKTLLNVLYSTQGHLKHLWHNSSFLSAWKYGIKSIFKKSYCTEMDLISDLYKAILRCPCSFMLDAQSILKELMNTLPIFDRFTFTANNESVTDICSLIDVLGNFLGE